MLGVDDDGFRTAICFRSSTLTPRRLSAFVVCSPPTSSSSSELLVFASLFLFGLYLYSGHLLLCSSLSSSALILQTSLSASLSNFHASLASLLNVFASPVALHRASPCGCVAPGRLSDGWAFRVSTYHVRKSMNALRGRGM